MKVSLYIQKATTFIEQLCYVERALCGVLSDDKFCGIEIAHEELFYIYDGKYLPSADADGEPFFDDDYEESWMKLSKHFMPEKTLAEIFDLLRSYVALDDYRINSNKLSEFEEDGTLRIGDDDLSNLEFSHMPISEIARRLGSYSRLRSEYDNLSETADKKRIASLAINAFCDNHPVESRLITYFDAKEHLERTIAAIVDRGVDPDECCIADSVFCSACGAMILPDEELYEHEYAYPLCLECSCDFEEEE